MKFSFLALAATLMVFAGCQSNTGENNPDNNNTATADSTPVAQAYFPVADFLRSEISYVDSLPVGIMKYHTRNNRTDSGYIKPEEFHQLAGEFLTPDLNDSSFRKNFTESSFFDRSSNYATFFYKANDSATPIKRIDVVTAKGDVYDEVKSIYIEKHGTEANAAVSKKLFWKPKRNFQIITVSHDSSEKSNGVVKVVWDNRE